jgi:hypothetical protein
MNQILNSAIESLLANASKELDLADEATQAGSTHLWQVRIITGTLCRVMAQSLMAARDGGPK